MSGLSLQSIPAESRADATMHERVEPLGAFFLRRLLAAPVTLCIMATCVALGYLSTFWGRDGWRDFVLSHMGERRWSEVLQGDVYQLLASTFLHRDTDHLQGNMAALFVFGLLLEPVIGARRMFLSFVLTALAGELPHLFTDRELSMLGASGGISGVAFVLIGARLRLGAPIRLPLGRHARTIVHGSALLSSGPLAVAAIARSHVVFAIMLLLGLAVELRPPVNLAHLGGATLGLALGCTLLLWPRPNASSGRQARSGPLLSASAALAATLAAGSIGWALIAGRPWSLRELPSMRTVALPRVPFDVDLPEAALAVADAPAPEPDSSIHLFTYGDLRQSPVKFSIIIGSKSDISNEEFAVMHQRTRSTSELRDNEMRRSVDRVTVNGATAIREVTDLESLVVTTLGQKVSGYNVRVVGYRPKWAAHPSHPAWDGIEQLILASLRLSRDPTPIP